MNANVLEVTGFEVNPILLLSRNKVDEDSVDLPSMDI
jgi:hypothetical protein